MKVLRFGAEPLVLLLTKVLRQLLNREQFATIADLKHAFALELARLRIPYQGWEMNEALDIVESNRRLLTLPRLRERPLEPWERGSA